MFPLSHYTLFFYAKSAAEGNREKLSAQSLTREIIQVSPGKYLLFLFPLCLSNDSEIFSFSAVDIAAWISRRKRMCTRKTMTRELEFFATKKL